MKKPRVLIIGSKGKIGKILTKNLSNFEVYGLDIIADNTERYCKADISDLEELRNVFEKISGFDYVIHLAADSRINADWESILKNNIIGTRNVYECTRRYKVKKVIFASSNHVTGGYEGIPPSLHKQENPPLIRATDSIRPDSDYASSKVFGEAVARQYFEIYNLSSICLRIGTVLEDDKPTKDERTMCTWLSHNDLIQLINKSLLSDISFGVYYGVSDNKGRFWDISNAEKEISYHPKDDASLR